MRLWLPLLLAIAAVPAAHHPFTPYYDASRPVSMVTFADGTTMTLGPTPGEGDEKWRCLTTDGCGAYTYPDARPR
jgi:hypothetical protein